MPEAGSGLAQAAQALGEAGGAAVYIGYSLGGRCCLQLALQAPSLVERLVLVGAHPGICDEPSRRLRRQADDLRATELERGGDPIVPEFLDIWLEGPLFAHLSEAQADRPSRLENSAAGLGASLRTVGTGRQPPLWDRLSDLEMPVLVMAGSHDDKFKALAEKTVDSIGHNARLAIVNGSGHAVPFERPEEFVALVRDFLASNL
jgi:2-succinyl-6-hydroxy-2,4-cyclohexadiene-1-carboxylate synthase